MASRYELYSRRGNFFSSLSVTNQLIFLNVILFFAFYLVALINNNFFSDYIALKPFSIIHGQSLWTLLTSMFAHAGLFHIFANMFSLFFIGNFLEKIIGKKRFFWTYIISGLFGGLFFVLFAYFGGISGLTNLFGGLEISGVGASGAIFGLLGVLAVLVPYSRIYLIAGPLIIIFIEVVLGLFVPSSFVPILNMVVNVLIIIMIFAIFSFNPRVRKLAVPVELRMWLLPIVAIVPLLIVGYFFPLPIGNSAHIGGLVVGLAYGFYLRKKFPRKTSIIQRHFT